MKKLWIAFIVGFLLCFTTGFSSVQNSYSTISQNASKNIIDTINGEYAVDYQVRGSYLDSLHKTYGDKIIIKNGYLNDWKLHIENVVKASNNEYIITCSYLLKEASYPPPMVESKLLVYLSDDGNVQRIEHKIFASTRWPNGEWKTNMIFYKQ